MADSTTTLNPKMSWRLKLLLLHSMLSQEKIRGTEETEMRRVVLALCVTLGTGLALLIPEVQVHSADKEQRFPLANRRSDHGQRRLHYLSHVEQYG